MSENTPILRPVLRVESKSNVPVVWNTPPEIQSIYTNTIEVNANIWDFTLRIGLIQKVTESEVLALEQAKILMSPQQAKVLAQVFSGVVAEYERRVGEIALGGAD
jgi:hypothetical protein